MCCPSRVVATRCVDVMAIDEEELVMRLRTDEISWRSEETLLHKDDLLRCRAMRHANTCL